MATLSAFPQPLPLYLEIDDLPVHCSDQRVLSELRAVFASIGDESGFLKMVLYRSPEGVSLFSLKLVSQSQVETLSLSLRLSFLLFAVPFVLFFCVCVHPCTPLRSHHFALFFIVLFWVHCHSLFL